MQVCGMRVDGSEQERVLTDESNDCFPHISPDGRWMVFLANGRNVDGYPANVDVELRVMSMADQKVRVLAKLLGGRGELSWSPDGKRMSFVSYSMLPQEDISLPADSSRKEPTGTRMVFG